MTGWPREAFAVARLLEAHAAEARIGPTDGFEDRVMAAIATEPAPRVVIRPGTAVRGGRPAAFPLGIRDAWAIATSSGRPFAVRAQALGVLLVVGNVATAMTGVAAVGVGGLLTQQPSPAPSLDPSLLPSPSPSMPSSSPRRARLLWAHRYGRG